MDCPSSLLYFEELLVFEGVLKPGSVPRWRISVSTEIWVDWIHAKVLFWVLLEPWSIAEGRMKIEGGRQKEKKDSTLATLARQKEAETQNTNHP